MSQQALTQGIHHLGLSVTDVVLARDFFIQALGFQLVAEKPDYPAAFVSDGAVMITLWQIETPESAAPFDRKKVVGLHHFALPLAGGISLDEAHERIKAHPNTEIEFAPECLGGGPTKHLMCTIPGGPRMELIAPAG